MTERVSRSHRLAVIDHAGGPPAETAVQMRGPTTRAGEPPRHPRLLRAGRIAALVVTVLLFVGTPRPAGARRPGSTPSCPR